jgi:hypothetical protein
MRHAYFLARRPEIDPTLPVKPMRTRLCRPIRPALAAIEFGNQTQPSVLRGIQMAGQLGNLSGQLAQ